MKRRIGIGALLTLAALLAVGCVKPRLHRPENIERVGDDFTVAYIEFDDQGEYWAPSQLERTIALIEKAIGMSDLGLTPNNDGKLIRINIPPLTEERRKELCKIASKYAEEGKVALRNVRRDAIDQIKKREKDGELSEDLSRDEQDKVQKVTDKFIADLEKLLAEKEADILKV